MAKPETLLWKVMKDRLPYPGDRLDRIENFVASGQPDVNGCLAGEDVWIELKAPKEPKRSTTRLMTCNGNHALLPSQVNWMIRQRQAGGIAFILVRTDKRIMLIEGTKHAEQFNSMTVPEMMLASLYQCSIPMAKDNWRMLRHVIYTASRYQRLAGHAKAQQLLDDLERGQG